EHAVAGGRVRDAVADLVDDPGRLVAHGLRELAVHEPLALLPVARVDAGRAYRDANLAGSRMRIREVNDLEDLRAPEAAEAGCPHQRLRSPENVRSERTTRTYDRLRRDPWISHGSRRERRRPRPERRRRRPFPGARRSGW